MSEREEEVSRLIDWTDEELERALGEQLAGRAAAGRPPGWYAEVGRRWMLERQVELAAFVCPDARVRSRRAGDARRERRIALGAVLANIVAAHYTGVPAATVAVLLFREGLDEQCSVPGRTGSASDDESNEG